MAKAPKTLKQQYNSLRRKAEKMLALPENTGRGLKLPKVPKRITRKSVARMGRFNDSIQQPNYARKIFRKERRKEFAKAQRKREAELRKQDPLYQQKIKENRSKASKAYWERLKKESPELYKERIDALIKARTEGLKKYRERMRKLKTDNPEEYRQLTESARESRSRASKKYWEELRKDPEKFQERLSAMRKGLEEYREKVRRGEIEPPPRKSGRRSPREVIDQVDETIEDIEQVEQIEAPSIETSTPKQPHEMTDEELTALMKEVSGGKVSQMPEVDENLIKDFEEVAKNLQKEPSIFDEWKDELGDIYEEVPAGYFDETYGAYDMGDKFEVSPFESIMVDKVYRQNFGDKLNYFSEIHAGSMAKYFISILSHELDNKNEVNYIIAKSIENGDLEIGWSRMYDTAKETASKLISALNKWIYREDPEFIVRHLSFNKQEFIDTINQIANDLDEGAEEWQIESRYDTGGII